MTPSSYIDDKIRAASKDLAQVTSTCMVSELYGLNILPRYCGVCLE